MTQGAANDGQKKPPSGEQSLAIPGIPSWAAFGGRPAGTIGVNIDREEVPELSWPTSVRTFSRMGDGDSQLVGLLRGTTLPIRRYVWGVDPNGAEPAVVDGVCADYNLEPIDQAWQAYTTGQSAPVARARNRITLDRHHQSALKSPQFGHAFFEHWGGIGDDGLWHPVDLAYITPWTIGQFFTEDGGDLNAIKQSIGFDFKPLAADRLVPYVMDQDRGYWQGKSLLRGCYREWIAKDRLLRIDVVNHEKAGGVLISEAPQGALPAEIEALGEMAANLRVGGGGAVPAGTNPVFLRATGSDVIASINRHDEAMSRPFLMTFMALGTSSSGGNRALAGSLIDWFAESQETLATWLCDVFNEQVIRRYVDWNWPDQKYLPKLVYRRPQDQNPVAAINTAATTDPGQPTAVGYFDENGALQPGATLSRTVGFGRAVILAADDLAAIADAHAEFERDAGRGPRPTRRTAAAAAVSTNTLPLPDRPLRRDPFPHEVAAATNFQQLDLQWTNSVDQLVADWQTIRAQQIAQLATAIEDADGNLAQLALIQAEVAGADLIAARLKAMAHTGTGQAVTEAAAQGVAATRPRIADLEAELESRAEAVATLLAQGLSQAAASNAVRLSGGALAPADVAGEVADYLTGLSNQYLTDTFGGAMSAAQNGGRLAAMTHNDATGYYASELLDANTCDPCAAEDGTRFASAADAASAYPAGGFKDCQGRERCRGTVVAVYNESEATVQ